MPMSLRGEEKQFSYERMLQECLKGELRVVNAGLPRIQKSLADLLHEEYPHVVCNDGSTYFLKEKELGYLANMIDTDEQKRLLLPMLIEVGLSEAEAAIICQGEVEEKLISKVLDMPLTCEQGRIKIYKPQLALLRRKLKTTTQYVFSPKIVAKLPI